MRRNALNNTEKKVMSLIETGVLDLGYDLYDVQYVKEGSDYFLRIYIENSDGISLDDCEKVSHLVAEILDEKDPIKDQYFLEVSSTGVEKELRKDEHLEKGIGLEVALKLFKPVNGGKEHTGILKGFTEEILTLEIDDENIEIDRKSIAQIKTVYNWD